MTYIEKINSFLWGFPVLILIICGGLYLSARLGFPQLHIIKIFRRTFETLFHRDKSSSHSSLSQLQGFSTALAATVGTGSIAGVGAALAVGGKGAVFWMWVSAFIGMGISYSENYLGTKYSKKSKFCGAMAYLEHLGAGKFPAYAYALFSVLASLGMGNMTQASSAVCAARDGLGIPLSAAATATVGFAAFTAIGKNSAAKLCEKLVPLMSLAFIGGSLIMILQAPHAALGAIKDIIASALSPKAAAGGALGSICMEGIKRGAFSNEAGLGSTCAVHSSCKIKSGEVQGVMGMAEVFIDTIVVCTLTALVIIISGVDFTADCAVKGYSAAFNGFGGYFISICLILFALATIAGWFFIGEKSWQCLFGENSFFYRALFILCAYFGSVYSPSLVWGISDIFNALTALPNMTGVLLLSKEIVPPSFSKSLPERDV